MLSKEACYVMERFPRSTVIGFLVLGCVLTALGLILILLRETVELPW
jgi:hypothetical protein